MAVDSTRLADRLFVRYGESHRHPTNKAIHWVCVPLITWSVLALFWSASPAYMFVAAALAFYRLIPLFIAFGMLAVTAIKVYPR